MPSNARNKRKERIGVVVSDKMDKTITVQVDWITHHPVYKKLMRRATKFKAHDEKNECLVGDEVRIVESRPYSKDKHWRVETVLQRAAQIDTTPLKSE